MYNHYTERGAQTKANDCLNQTALNTLKLLNLYQSSFHIMTLICLYVCFVATLVDMPISDCTSKFEL